MSNPPPDYAKVADALEGFYPLMDETGRERVIVIMAPSVLQFIRDGLRKLARIEGDVTPPPAPPAQQPRF